jgi:hypothetical protein
MMFSKVAEVLRLAPWYISETHVFDLARTLLISSDSVICSEAVARMDWHGVGAMTAYRKQDNGSITIKESM